MNAPQIHLMLNHVPVVGTLFVILTLGAALMFRSAALHRFGLAVLVGVALMGVPVFFSGEASEERVEHLSGVSEATIEAHEDLAKIAMVALGVLGLLALPGLASARVRTRLSYATVMLALAIGLGLVMAWTAHLGGRVRHPEIRDGTALVTHEVEEDRP